MLLQSYATKQANKQAKRIKQTKQREHVKKQMIKETIYSQGTNVGLDLASIDPLN